MGTGGWESEVFFNNKVVSRSTGGWVVAFGLELGGWGWGWFINGAQ